MQIFSRPQITFGDKKTGKMQITPTKIIIAMPGQKPVSERETGRTRIPAPIIVAANKKIPFTLSELVPHLVIYLVNYLFGIRASQELIEFLKQKPSA